MSQKLPLILEPRAKYTAQLDTPLNKSQIARYKDQSRDKSVDKSRDFSSHSEIKQFPDGEKPLVSELRSLRKKNGEVALDQTTLCNRIYLLQAEDDKIKKSISKTQAQMERIIEA